jgi:hypothetical protein
MCLLVQQENRPRHVSFCLRQQRVGDEYFMFSVVAQVSTTSKYQGLCTLGIRDAR